MAKTKVLNTFTGGAEKFLEQNAGVSNIIIANIANANVKASVRVNIPEGSAYCKRRGNTSWNLFTSFG